MARCPYCGIEVMNAAEEIAHMNAKHSDVIEQRLGEANIRIEDYRHGPDLPSYLTLKELQTVLIFATRFAVDQDGYANEGAMIGILVRDRGMASPRTPAHWVEFSVGVKQYALWRNTLDLYEVGPDGAVADEPIHRND